MNIEDLIKRWENKENTDEEWLQLEKDMIQFLSEENKLEEKRKLSPLGILESTVIICDGIKRKKGLIK